MALLRFYIVCLRRVLRTTWFLISLASTLLTFVIPFIVNWCTTIESGTLNTFIWVLPFGLLGFCLLVVPWAEAFRLYQEKIIQLDAEMQKHTEQEQQWEQERAALKAQIEGSGLQDPQRDHVHGVLTKLDDCSFNFSRI
jgi:hypothetical protein